MKLYSRKWERSLRNAVRAEIRKSPSLKREFQQSKGRRKRSRVLAIFGGIVIPAALVLLMEQKTHQTAASLAVLTVILFLGSLLGAATFDATLHNVEALLPMFSLPIEDEDILSVYAREIFKRHLLVLVIVEISLTCLAAKAGISLEFLPGVLLAGVLTWLMEMAVALHILAWMRKPLRSAINAAMICGVFIAFISWKLTGQFVVAFFTDHGQFINLLVPNGWALALYQVLLPNPQWNLLLLLLPIGLFIASALYSYWVIQRRFSYMEVHWSFDADVVPDLIPVTASVSDVVRLRPDGKPVHLGEHAIEEVILARQYLAEPAWPKRGFMEKWFWQWLNKREKALVDIVFPDGPTFSASWLAILNILAGTIVAGLLVRIIIPAAEYCAMGIGFASVLLFILLALNRTGMPFRIVNNSGVGISVYVFFGAGFNELATLLLKSAVVQMPAVFGMTLVISAVLVKFFEGSAVMILEGGIKAGLMIFATRFLVTIYRFADGTREGGRFKSGILLISSAILLFMFLIAGGAGVFLPGLGGWLLCAGAFLDAVVAFYFYRWFYHMRGFDLMRIPRRNRLL